MINAGFESGASSNWTWTYGNFSIANTGVHSGDYAAKVSGASGGTGQVISGLTPNTSYTLSAWAKVGSAGESIAVGVKRYAGESSDTSTDVTTTTYSQANVTFTTGANNTSAEIYLWKNAGNGDAHGDDFSLTLATVNRATNPGFESGDLGVWSTWTAAASVVTSNARTGTYAARLSGAVVGVEQTVSGLTPNMTYTLSGWAKVGAVGENIFIGVKDFGGIETSTTVTTASYSQGTVVFTTGSGNTTAKIYFYKHTGSGEAFGDDFSLR
ncbi:MAG: carbohydrate binding domain-containing protein [Roseiflexaceae bacterium]|nr:carbohydrate binding domain-containing protein [Roseiflexaceae bacterium]